MQVPKDLETLYKHWEHHTNYKEKETNLKIPNELEWFITERMRIWEKKSRSLKPPYTKDLTLQKYKFCNIYRELDRQTIEIHKSLRNYLNDFPLWLLNVSFQRFICNPSTIAKTGTLNFDPKNNKGVYNNLKTLPEPKYGSAYVFPISLLQKSAFPSREEFLCFFLPKVTPSIAYKVNSFKNTPVNEALKQILPILGFNFRFHLTEILIDTAYQFPDKIDLFRDFYIGPGAIPTANKLNPHNDPIKTVDSCVDIRLKSFPYLTFNNKPVKLSAENWEGIFCEYRKYTNLKAGKGRVRKFKSKVN